ncbi:GntR family transcriptional regulator [Plebeiibacterium marinum]|uniref:GntR family transcriptional regulator n=1 Tax=Plebeiibacterium marinum TaxID=2992111 RepID=A0AAE3MDQ2_9BACT|nr:GntR family transcriptional regulator [Plebeiobacterium marinum]MCW3805649.1 GntR family transcriptional regulator [Plebeiobacterium marinum]
MSDFIPNIDESSSVPKFLQVVDAFEEAVKSNKMKVGDNLPSVNEMCSRCGLSRDTVFKAYSELKNRRLIESVPNKGYYVSSNTSNVFLFLDTLKAYKEVLYGAFRSALPSRVNVDVHFHHYNPRVFEDIVRNAAGKYSHYIIMNFDDDRVKSALKLIDPSKLLCIDWKINVPPKSSFIGQDFGAPVYNNLLKVEDKLKRYSRLLLVYPEYTNHPKETVEYFKKYCSERQIHHDVIYSLDDLHPQKGELYFTVSDRVLAILLDMSSDKGLVLGTDIGIISYNETPTKKYIKDGISVLSTDFALMGKKMAYFVEQELKLNEFVDTEIIERSSL